MTGDRELSMLPQPATDDERRNVSLLLQENRAYADGGSCSSNAPRVAAEGFDVYLVAGRTERNLSDRGDDACGQPSPSPSGQRALYIPVMAN